MEWLLSDSYIDCGDCDELYDGRPPCADCNVPFQKEGASPYFQAIEQWRSLSFYSRPISQAGILPIPLSEMVAYLAALDEPQERLEEIQWIEAYAYPIFCKTNEKDQTDG